MFLDICVREGQVSKTEIAIYLILKFSQGFLLFVAAGFLCSAIFKIKKSVQEIDIQQK